MPKVPGEDHDPLKCRGVDCPFCDEIQDYANLQAKNEDWVPWMEDPVEVDRAWAPVDPGTEKDDT
jgi:hypothetical protein